MPARTPDIGQRAGPISSPHTGDTGDFAVRQADMPHLIRIFAPEYQDRDETLTVPARISVISAATPITSLRLCSFTIRIAETCSHDPMRGVRTTTDYWGASAAWRIRRMKFSQQG